MQAISREEIINLMRAKQGSMSLRKFADEMGCSAAYLSDIYSKQRNPGKKILDRLGLTFKKKILITYSKKRASR